MFKLPEFPSIDFSQLDLNALRESDLAKRLAAVDTDKVTTAVRDAAYMTVGLGVVAVESAQARSRKFAATVNERFASGKPRVDAVRSTVEGRLARFDERVEAVEARIDSVVDRIEGALPEQAGHLVGQARDITRVARKQVRGLVRNAA